jgi:hypothetical protein
MADDSIRVLQLADLLIDDSEEDEKSAQKLYQGISERLGRPEAKYYVDYIVVCGNITRHGKPPEFARAFRVLEALAGAVLSPALHEHWRTRTIVVPGSCDRGPENAPDERPFDEFYEQLTAGSVDYEQMATAWHDPQGGGLKRYVRVFDGLTTIGFYWDATISAEASEAMWRALESNLRNWSAGGPILLVSASAPIPPLAEDTCGQPPGRVFHLLGHAPYPRFDTVRYHALKWDPQDRDLRRLSRGLILTLQRGWPRVQTFEFGSFYGNSNSEATAARRADSPAFPFSQQQPAESKRADKSFAFAKTCDKLWHLLVKTKPDKAAPPKLVFIRGVPGAGKFSFFKTMKDAKGEGFCSASNTEDGGGDDRCIVRAIKLLPDLSFEDCKAEIEAVEDALRTKIGNPDTTCGVLVVYDQGLVLGRRARTVQDQRTVVDLLLTRSAAGRTRVERVYLTDDEVGLSSYLDEFDKKTGDEAMPDNAASLPRREDHLQLWLPPLSDANPDEWADFLARYDPARYDRLSFDQQDIKVFTGRLRGFAIRVLEALWAEVVHPAGSRSDSEIVPITRNRRWRTLLDLPNRYLEVADIKGRMCDYLNRTLGASVRYHLHSLGTRYQESPPQRGIDRLMTTHAEYMALLPRAGVAPSQEDWMEFQKWLELWGAPSSSAGYDIGFLLPILLPALPETGILGPTSTTQ